MRISDRSRVSNKATQSEHLKCELIKTAGKEECRVMLPWQLPAHEDKGYTSSRARRRSEAMRADTQTQIHSRSPNESSCVCLFHLTNLGLRTRLSQGFSSYQQYIFTICSVSKHKHHLMLVKVLKM